MARPLFCRVMYFLHTLFFAAEGPCRACVTRLHGERDVVAAGALVPGSNDDSEGPPVLAIPIPEPGQPG